MKFRSIIFTLLFLMVSGLWAQDMNQPSKKELFRRARDVLKASLESKDYEKAGQALGYLQENVKEGAPLLVFEEYLAEMEMGRYEEGIRNYANQRRILLDSAYNPPNDQRINEKDGLQNYLYGKFEGFNKAKADSMVNLVDASDASQESKDLYASLIYGEVLISVRVVTYGTHSFLVREITDTTAAEGFLTRSKQFVERNPYSEHTGYLKDRMIPFVQNYMDKQRLFRKDPLAHKYYTGGLGIFAGMWAGFFAGDFTDHFDTEMGSSMILEASLQVRRISLNAYINYGFMNMPKDYEFRWEQHEDESLGLTLGFTAYDSRWLKAEPFVGVGVYIFDNTENADESTVFLLGANADVRLLASKPSRIGGTSFALVARFKYMMQFGSYYEYVNASQNYNKERGWVDEPLEIEAGFVNFQFGLSLGLYLW